MSHPHPDLSLEIGRLQGQARELSKRLDDAKWTIDLILESLLRAALPVSQEGLDILARFEAARERGASEQKKENK